MTIDEQIEQKRAELLELNSLKEAEIKKGWPDMVGKYYKPFGNIALKVTCVIDHNPLYNESNIACETIRIEKGCVCIDLKDNYYDIHLTDEITKEEFNAWYDKAINFINQQK